MKLSEYINQQDNIVTAIQNNSAVKIHSEFRDLRNFVNDNLLRINKIEDSYTKQKAMKSFRSELQAKYTADLSKVMGTILQDTNRLVSTQEAIVSHLGYEPKDMDYQTIRLISDYSFQKLGGQSQIVTGDVAKHLQALAFNRRPFKDIVSDIGRSMRKGAHYAETLANTAIQSVDRGVAGELAESVGISWYKYMGSNDKATRAFCKAILMGENPNGLESPVDGVWWHISWIMRLENNQIENVRISGGGFNCRHRWVGARFAKNRELNNRYPELTRIKSEPTDNIKTVDEVLAGD